MISEEEITAMETEASSGSKMIKVSDGMNVFLNKLESHIRRGDNFERLTPIEFECIFDIKMTTMRKMIHKK